MKQKKLRIRYKNICITYNNCFEVGLNNIKAFFIDLFKYHYKTNEIKYLLISENQEENQTKVLLLLTKKPDWNSVEKFIFQNEKPEFKNEASPQALRDEIIEDSQDNEFITYIEHKEFINNVDTSNISQDKPKEQEDKLWNFLTDFRTRFTHDKNMTTADASRLIDEWLDENKNSKRYTSITQIEKIKHKYFARPIDPAKNRIIYDLNRFKLSNQDIQNIIDIILENLKKLIKKGRCNSIIIEGHTKIGKTSFIISLLKFLKIIFNLKKKVLDFSRLFYSDDALIDIWDDLNIFDIREQKLFESIFTCDQIGTTIKNPDKFEKQRVLIKNHLSIFLCNPHTSFFSYVEKTKETTKEYLKENITFYNIYSKEVFYLKDEEELEEEVEKFKNNNINNIHDEKIKALEEEITEIKKEVEKNEEIKKEIIERFKKIINSK
ncbi:MAG: hypothetical protein Q8901_02380 [Candidatus Phytoplasma stylosanthis]|nr:hypothetical protein [Candidatus Phytoplasma stylosanthis]